MKRIASAAGVTPEALRDENPGFNFPLMRVGQQVHLPANATIPTPLVRAKTAIPADQIHVVQPGDTLLKIAQKKDLLPDELKALNPEIDWQKLRVGQPIRAP